MFKAFGSGSVETVAWKITFRSTACRKNVLSTSLEHIAYLKHIECEVLFHYILQNEWGGGEIDGPCVKVWLWRAVTEK